MAHAGKRYAKAAEVAKQALGSNDGLELAKAIEVAKANATAKFDETLEMAVRLGVDPKHADQMVRGTVVLPHGTGKKVRVLVFAKGQKEKEALDAGADFAGGEELIEKISKGWLDFDKAIATPDIMGLVSKLGKILGPRGLMPNPKVGTVTFDLERAVKEIKAGKVEFKVEKAGVVHVPMGKISFGQNRLLENIKTLMDVILRVKPPTSKGVYLRGIALSTTMGPGIKIDPVQIRNIAKA